MHECNPTLALGIVWQLMRSYTLSLLSRLGDHQEGPITEAEIVHWANNKHDVCIRNFQDKVCFPSL